MVCWFSVESCAPRTFWVLPGFDLVLSSCVFAGAQTTSWFFFTVFGHVVSPFSAPVADSYLCGKYGSGRGLPDLQCPFKDRRGGDQHCLCFSTSLFDGDEFA